MSLKHFQKQLKSNQTHAEDRLWYHLRDRRMDGYKFRRQAIIDQYIVDFICFEKQLILECDGGQHNQQEAISYDQARTLHLTCKGYQVLRFWNDDILKQTSSVLETIRQALGK